MAARFTKETDYVRPDETIETCIVNDTRVVHVHYKNGYYSLIEGMSNLRAFLNGFTNARFACVDTMGEVFSTLDKLQ